jgi:hypothetical protein
VAGGQPRSVVIPPAAGRPCPSSPAPATSPVASVDGSSTRNLNRIGVRLWTESSYAPDAKKIAFFVKSSFAQVPYSVFRRHLGMNTTVVLALPPRVIQTLDCVHQDASSRVLGGPRAKYRRWAHSLRCHASTVSPAEPGGPPGDARSAAKVAPFAHREHLVWTRTFGNHRCAARSPVK